MKLAYITQYYPPHTGGLEQVAQKLAQRARSDGHKVSVVTFALPGMRSSTVEEDGVQVHRVRGMHFFDAYFGIPFCLGGTGLVRTVFRVVRQADIVHIHDVFYLSSLVGYLAAHWYDKPLVLTQHVGLVQHSSALVMFIERLVYALWGRRIFRASARSITHQPIVRDFLLAQGVPKERILEVHNGIDVQRFYPVDAAEKAQRREALGLPANRPLVLFVGRLVPKKGYRELYAARDPRYDLVFVGPGHVPKEWHGTKGVHVLGPRTQDELARLYPAMDIFAAPSRGEMFTLVMQEAMASGLPVVTTDAPEYDAYDLDQRLFVRCAPNPVTLRRELVRLADDNARRQRMGEYARSLACRLFDWDKNAGEVLDLYAAIHARPRVLVTTSWDDGHVDDLKLARLLKCYGVAGTFYVAPENGELDAGKRLSSDALKELAHDFEIGAHTLTHRHLPDLGDDDARHEVASSKIVLEETLGAPVECFCYPAGKYRARHTAMVRDAGYKLARTVRRFAEQVRPDQYFELPTTIHTYDHWLDIWGLMRFVRFNPIAFLHFYRRWDEQAIALFDRINEHGGVFHLWGHSWELNDRDGWRRLERVLEHIARREHVAYVTNRGLA